MTTLAERPDSPAAQLIGERAEGWRAALMGEYEDPHLFEASIAELIERYLQSMGRDAMQQTIEALSTRLDFPIEINLLDFHHTIPTTIDGKPALGSVVRNREHYFIGYRQGNS